MSHSKESVPAQKLTPSIFTAVTVEETGNRTALIRINRQEYDAALRAHTLPVFQLSSGEVIAQQSDTVSSARPIVGITAQFVGADDEWIVVRREVLTALTDCIPLVIYAGMDPDLISLCLAQLSGLIIPGGQNLNRYWFDESTDLPNFDSKELAQDVLELRLVAWALNNNIPVMGICRGLQVMAALAGLHVGDVSSEKIKHSHQPQEYCKLTKQESWHQIWLEPHYLTLICTLPADDPLRQWLEKIDGLWVNSMHHQGSTGITNPNRNKVWLVARLDPEIQATSKLQREDPNDQIMPDGLQFHTVGSSRDGVAEVGVFVDGLGTIKGWGFQGHPEVGAMAVADQKVVAYNQVAFNSFLEAVKDYALKDRNF